MSPLRMYDFLKVDQKSRNEGRILRMSVMSVISFSFLVQAGKFGGTSELTPRAKLGVSASLRPSNLHPQHWH